MAAMDYRGGKAMLAPMVRVGTLPMVRNMLRLITCV